MGEEKKVTNFSVLKKHRNLEKFRDFINTFPVKLV